MPLLKESFTTLAQMFFSGKWLGLGLDFLNVPSPIKVFPGYIMIVPRSSKVRTFLGDQAIANPDPTYDTNSNGGMLTVQYARITVMKRCTHLKNPHQN